METINIFDIQEDDLLGILNSLPNLWNSKKTRSEPSLDLLFDKYGDKDNLLFVVQAFTHPYSNVMIVLLTEYLSDLKAASFIIYAYDLNLVGGARESLWSGRRLRDILEDCIDIDLGAFSHLRGDEIFVCPLCSARYRLKAMRITRDGQVECQNCGKIVEYGEMNRGS